LYFLNKYTFLDSNKGISIYNSSLNKRDAGARTNLGED
jgi:hypothetical protein